MSILNYSLELHEFQESITPYGTLEISPPTVETLSIDNFNSGTHFRTKTTTEDHLTLQLEDRLLSMILDESGSMTWNDHNGDRFIYLTRLLNKLKYTYPGSIKTILIGFGGVLTKTNLLVTQAQPSTISTDNETNVGLLLQQVFQDSTYDFAGVRVVRRADRFPEHPADGFVIGEGIFDAVKDAQLSQGTTYYYGIWSFNKNLHFSNGQFVSGTPRDRILPQGVNFALSTPRILPGIQRDEYVQLILNFAEKSGRITFDSSGNGRHGTLGDEVLESNFWTGDASANPVSNDGTPLYPTGVRFDGTFDIVEVDINDHFAYIGNMVSNSQSIFVNFWIYRYPRTDNEWILGTSTATTSNDIGWAFGVDPSGNLLIEFLDISPGFTTTMPVFIPEQTWTMVSVNMKSSGTADIYLDGTFNYTQSLDPAFDVSGMDKLYIGAKPATDVIMWPGVDFFGILAQISIANTIRSSDYIFELFKQEALIFNQTLQNAALAPPDNGQREVLLYWEIGSDFDFSGGKVKIVRRYRHVPSHENDGDIVVEQSASVGQFFYLDTYDFIHNSDYYYRIFTLNALELPCDRNDARILPTHIQKSLLDYSQFIVEPINNLSVTNGSKKIMLQWSNPDDDNWRGTKIFFGAERYPTISFSSQGDLTVSDGFEVYDNTQEIFIHRKIGISNNGVPIPLVNGTFHYYTIITYDTFGNFSQPVLITGQPISQNSDIVFPPAEIEDLHLTIVNPKTLSVQWTNPLVRTDQLDLFFGESALLFVNVRDIFGGTLDDILNLKLQVCTTIIERELEAVEEVLGIFGPGNALINPCNAAGIVLINGGCEHGANFEEDCNTEQELEETVLNFAAVQSGLIKGLLTHTANRNILARRERYDMDVRAQYTVVDTETNELIFQFNTEAVQVSFHHPLQLSIRNLLNKTVIIQCDSETQIRGNSACPEADNCNSVTTLSPCQPTIFNGSYARSASPYVARIELQYKGEALPNGTPISVSLFKHSTDLSLAEPAERTSLIEGSYLTTSVTESQVDADGNSTNQLISKSIVDISIIPPLLPENVDLYISVDHMGFFVDGIHTIRFVNQVQIRLNANRPTPNGISVAEQFANVYYVNPDTPNDTELQIPVADGTLVKWELVKLRFGRERPFYSTEQLGQSISGVYSRTISGVARNVFLGPIGNITSHILSICDGQDVCCIGEEYAVKVTVIVDEQTTSDAQYVVFGCTEEELEFENRRFLMNAAPNQSGQAPNYVTWADGESLLHFQIAQNPALSDILGAECFRQCVESEVGGQLFPFPQGHIVEITAYADILWNVVFEEDPYTAEITPVSFNIASSSLADNVLIPAVAGIPVSNETTDFYVRLNTFIGDKNPMPQDCEQSNSSFGLGSEGEVLLACEWESVCHDVPICSPAKGARWTNVYAMTGRSTLLSDNMAVTLFGGGNYDTGMPPIMLGFKEPLDVRIIEARVNGERLSVLQQLVVDGISQHTFIVEVTFSNNLVPDGTPIEITIEGADQNVVVLSNCQQSIPGCNTSSGGIVYTRQVNDLFINPDGNKRSLAYFSIDPLSNVNFSAKINVTCRYDKLGTTTREMTKCVQLINAVNTETSSDITPPISPSDQPVSTSVSSNETIIYDTVEDLYEKTTSSHINRIGHFSETITSGTDDLIYIFGGYTEHDLDGSKGITATTETFSRSNRQWTFSSDMPTPRSNGSTVVVDNVIYCVGGLEFDALTQQYKVSRKIESFNTSFGVWNESLSPMPENYGVAYGNAFIVNNDNIYVICGITEVVNNSQAETLNDRILKYNIADDEWTIIIPSEDNAYKRIAPFGFYRFNPLSSGATDSDKLIYVYGGSIPKPREQIETEFQAEFNAQLNAFRSFILTSTYFLSLTESEQTAFIQTEEQRIRDSIHISPFIYPSTGFTFLPNSELTVNDVTSITLSANIDAVWPVLPMARDRGQCTYLSDSDVAYFLGGSNQNQSTTLNRVESINLQNDNEYTKLSPLGRGLAQFASVSIGADIYIMGGLSSGHREGYVNIEIAQLPTFVEAIGNQSSGIIITLRNDAGEIITDDVNCLIRGRVRIDEIDSSLVDFLAARAADRALGGDGTGSAEIPDNPDPSLIYNAQNQIVDPNSDEFQFNAAKKLNQQLFLFPVLYTKQELTISGGIGGTTLLPRSEDPLADIQKLSQFIQNVTNNVPSDSTQTFEGDLTRDELIALGDVLQTISLPPIILNTNTVRKLYDVETVVTILDDFYFGQTVSELDTEFQDAITDRIVELLTPEPPPPADDEETPSSSPGMLPGLSIPSGFDTECFVLQHVSSSQIPNQNTPSSPNSSSDEPSGMGGFAQSGQCLFCTSLLPLTPQIRNQQPTSVCTFFNKTDWVPQIKKRLINSNGHDIDEALEELDTIDHETPFGSSQLYNAIIEASRVAGGETFDTIKKSFYIMSDNSQNLSLSSRTDAIEAVNSVDGLQQSPVVYVVFSTSFPSTLSAQLERTSVDDVEQLTSQTGGQGSVLLSSSFMDQILNLTMGQASGGLGWGVYTRTVVFEGLTAITSISKTFDLPSNTNGYIRYKYSQDGYTFTDYSERMTGTGDVDFIDFFAKILILEVTLTTGFTADIYEEYDSIETGLPELVSLSLVISKEKTDYLYLNKETVNTNVQQVAVGIDTALEPTATAYVGVAMSNSGDWRDYASPARPSLNELGKTIILQRNNEQSENSIVPLETLISRDGWLYKTNYGSWDPQATVTLYRENSDGTQTEITNGFQLYPREGEVYFAQSQPPDATFRISVVNENTLKVGIQFKNRLHTEPIVLGGAGYMYSTNEIKPPELSQVAPRAINLAISPDQPNSSDTIMALYLFLDPNNDQESGSLITWFKNDAIVPELQNKSVWNNDNLAQNNKLSPGDRIYFIITPSDGTDLGRPLTSPTTTIVPRPPNAGTISLIALKDNIPQDRFDTSSTFRVQYSFSNPDSGTTAQENGTIIKWLVDGSLFKSGTYPFTSGLDPRDLLPTELSSGVSAHLIGNVISCEVTPHTSLLSGTAVVSSSITVVNTIPSVSNATIIPTQPTQQSTLQLNYTISDPDITNQVENQTNQSEIKWFVSVDNSTFTEVIELRNVLSVPMIYLDAGQYWKAEITPFDGLDAGVVFTSNVVHVLN